jgi:myo-inositol 2-dehydrogenase/D-chiro-inositol 1-dehydrogenase
MSTSPPHRPPPGQAAERLRVGVVGAGGIAHSHLSAWQRLGASATVWSIDGRGVEVGARYGAGFATDLAELIAASDVIDVCTPTWTHPEIVQAAAAAGRHVICEKPLALTHRAAAAMITVCADAGVQLHPAQVVRFFGEYAAAERAVRAGRIGTPAVLRLSRRSAAPVAAWFADPTLSGGIMVDQMIHDFDYARWIAGEVTTAYARTVSGPGGTVTAFDVLRHASGALAHLVGAWAGPDEVFATSFSLAGSTGLLRHSSAASTAVTWSGVTDTRAGAVIPGGAGQRSPFDDELGEFAAAIAGGPAPRVSAADSLAALDIALAAARSAELGRPVSIEEVQAS